MPMLARLEEEVPERDRRASPRRKLRLETGGSSSTAPHSRVVIHDLSQSGLLIESPAALAVGEDLEVHIPEAGAVEAEVVWSSGRFFGCRFKQGISTAAVSAAQLQSAPHPAQAGASDLLSIAMVEVRTLGFHVRALAEKLDRALDRLSDRRKR